MANKKVIGAVLLAAGAGLLVYGFQLYGAFGNKMMRAFGGNTSTEAMIYLGAGAVCAVLGALALFKK